ncbi:hypothetical protein B0H13DRAFT_1902674 [Mycena leptocephala]|nr:hypothetical protein B0H13DRAFT_1902674 [Mycena leptocephala]
MVQFNFRPSFSLAHTTEATPISISFVQLPKLCALVHSCRQRRVLCKSLHSVAEAVVNSKNPSKITLAIDFGLHNCGEIQPGLYTPEQYANVKAVDDETGMIRAMCGWGKWIRWVQACFGAVEGVDAPLIAFPPFGLLLRTLRSISLWTAYLFLNIEHLYITYSSSPSICELHPYFTPTRHISYFHPFSTLRFYDFLGPLHRFSASPVHHIPWTSDPHFCLPELNSLLRHSHRWQAEGEEDPMAGYPAFRKVGFEDIGRLEADLDDYGDGVKWVKDRK